MMQLFVLDIILEQDIYIHPDIVIKVYINDNTQVEHFYYSQNSGALHY